MTNSNKSKISYIFFFHIILCTLRPIHLPAQSIQSAQSTQSPSTDSLILSYIIDPAKQALQFYWRDSHNTPYASIQHLKDDCESRYQHLIFATNGGMYNPDNSPKGLYIQQHHLVIPLDTSSGDGNFYLKPNGVLLITQNKKAWIHPTSSLISQVGSNSTAGSSHGIAANDGPLDSIAFATQSGPMLIIDGTIHPAFKKGSANLNIRNGVGILPGNRLIFAISKQPINFYEFAQFFLHQGCRNALYLDGFVSRMYLPEKNWTQTDGNFGVIIAVTEQAK